MTKRSLPTLSREWVVRLWLERQGLSAPRGADGLDRARFLDHLTRTGGLQLDTVNVLDRAHYLTLWSRWGAYDRRLVDRWVYRERAAYEYWGHEACILPIDHLPLGRRRMRSFPPRSWSERSWWEAYRTSTASKRRVLRRLRTEGPLESSDFERRPEEQRGGDLPWGAAFPKEDKRSLKLLWHDGRVAVRSRRHFRCVYDLAERVYPETPAARTSDYEDSWLLIGLSGNGVASERHLTSYLTGPAPDAAARKRVIGRNLARGTIVQVRVEGLRGTHYALPEHLGPRDPPREPEGTTLLSPFDSLLWQRKRAEELLGFRYRIEIYTPAPKRRFGYYVLPILHDGRLVGRLDPKLHRSDARLEIKSIHLEESVARTGRLERGLSEALVSLAEFVGASDVSMPRDWKL